MLTTLLMFALLLVAVCTDLRSGKIYNWNTYPGIALALVIGTINSYWAGGRCSDWPVRLRCDSDCLLCFSEFQWWNWRWRR
jgi:hypothetical protein